MNTHWHKSLSPGLFQAALILVLLPAFRISDAQTFFGSGGPTNTAPNVLNVALGFGTLYATTTSTGNTAIGYSALARVISGSFNSATGYNTLFNNTTGNYNTANGFQALLSNTSGSDNTATGFDALYSNTTGSTNIAIGYEAGYNLTTGRNNIDIGNAGTAGDYGVIHLGTQGTQAATFIAGISGVTASGGVGVFINANGQLGTLTSSRRFKKDIHTMGQASDKLMQLRAVTFRYKDTAEKGAHRLQYGLIAEEVARVYPELVQYDQAGKPFTVYYHLLTPMLLNELQKEHRQVVAQKNEIAALKQSQKSEVASLKAALQKQSAELASLK